LGLFQQKSRPRLPCAPGPRTIETTDPSRRNDEYERIDRGRLGRGKRLSLDPRAQGGWRGAAPADEGPFIRGSGEGIGVHLLTGPVAIEKRRTGDVLEVRS